MSDLDTDSNDLSGLSSHEARRLQDQYGKNTFESDSHRQFYHIAWEIIKEPMFLLLLAACSLYFILGAISEGIMMLVAMTIVTAISLYQEIKSSKALKALKDLTEPKISVIRDGKESIIPSEDIVPGDIILLSEGMRVPADSLVIRQNDLSVNESIVTGESLPVDKQEGSDNNKLYQGTTINTGKCVAKVSTTGNSTLLGKLGRQVGHYQPTKSLLQQQIHKMVRRLALFGFFGFVIIFAVNFIHHRDWVASLLFALALAMSAIPEEIPVAFSSFMALGAFKMSKFGIITRRPTTVETLGAVTVICLDKTGTITENKMQVRAVYDYHADTLSELTGDKQLSHSKVLFYGVLASEIEPFDPMEQAIWEAYRSQEEINGTTDMKMVFEYPLEGKPPMMTHVYQRSGVNVIAAKGGAERILNVCRLGQKDQEKNTAHLNSLASKGYRVIGVASASYKQEKFPANQEHFDWNFEGLLALYDPPKKNIAGVLKKFSEAQIAIKLITGDHTQTAINIAQQVGISNRSNPMTGEDVMAMTDTDLKKAADSVTIFARMFPDAKLKVIEALKSNGEVVVMTGDGVNDGPALKAAHIGIAMGKKGTAIAREASDLVLTDDNLERIVTAIEAGRKIFSNLKKAIRYIISIHIPIILLASLPVIFGWAYPNIFTPIHVIFMELIMGPTCSIFFEREPVEENIMKQRAERKQGLFTRGELLTSITQGLVIAGGCLSLYFFYMQQGTSLEQTRAIVFTTLITSNIFLTFTNRSFTKSIYYTSRYKNSLAPYVILVSATFLLLLHMVTAVRELFQLAPISFTQMLVCVAVALVSVLWFELVKVFRSKRLTD